VQILKDVKKKIVVILVFASLLIAPLGGEYLTYLVSLSLVYAISALALNMLLGYNGQLSFGHALFFGGGAYGVALLIKHFGIYSAEILFPVTIGSVAILSLATGILCVRHTRVYFTMLTLAISQLFYALAMKLTPITGGDNGIRIPMISFLGYKPSSLSEYYYIVLLSFILCFLALRIIINSPFGLTIQAIRDNEERVRFAGVNVVLYKLAAFTISGTFAGIAGVIYAPLLGHVSPDDTLSILVSGEFVAMTLLGGFTSFIGPVVGAFAYTFLKAVVSSAVIYWYLVFGALIIGVVIFLPTGITGELEKRLRKWGF
jgi:branched-chain amino acid transport system permease protein